MDKNFILGGRYWVHAMYLLLAMFVVCFTGCKDDDDTGAGVYDPAKPVVVSDFAPKEGGAGQRLVIYGDNFGNDKSKVRVLIGGKEAVVVSVQNTAIYCFVPSQAYDGDIKVYVGEEGNEQMGESATVFAYERKMVVGTLCGYRNDRDDQGWKDGSFDECCGFRNDGYLKFDPRNHDHLYVCYDGADIQLLDLKNRMLSTPISRSRFGNRRLRNLDFTADGEYMLVATDCDEGTGNSPSVWIVTRDGNGVFSNDSPVQTIASYKQCNGAAIHPVNGEMYFNSYERGQVFRMEMEDYFNTIAAGEQWDPTFDGRNYEELFTIQDTQWEFQIQIHPTGKYAYIVVINQHYILRSDYNEAEKRFAPPYVVAGESRSRGWTDAVGASARLNRPYQGVFVKNPEYAGQEDEYDFYFCDNQNHCIRCLTPDGRVTTYAGRGSASAVADNNVWGTEDGDLREVARFRDPTGLAYDEETNTFYILDTVGRKIRTISMEGENASTGDDTESSDQSNE